MLPILLWSPCTADGVMRLGGLIIIIQAHCGHTIHHHSILHSIYLAMLCICTWYICCTVTWSMELIISYNTKTDVWMEKTTEKSGSKLVFKPKYKSNYKSLPSLVWFPALPLDDSTCCKEDTMKIWQLIYIEKNKFNNEINIWQCRKMHHLCFVSQPFTVLVIIHLALP